ncbi:hypothetical protein B0H16DRAFT_1618219 [Mycena metata]|uniref:Uncharacterized protein n=1 Tax=Mycena metata TaxID=1033252 RepID=A0AAD7MFC3_9AGAR|nr:hypothetical protein B0H16DRAFT_1618219 [Mycena metata]
MSITLNQDVFSHILSHVSDSKTLYKVLDALPKLDPLFFVALRRLCELPVYLDTFDLRSATASNQILDHLLSSSRDLPDFPGIAESIRHLVIRVEHNKCERPPEPPVEEEEQDGEQVTNDEEYEVYTYETEESEPKDDVDVVAFHERLPDLFKKTQNLESLDYHSVPGLALSEEVIKSLAACERLRTFGVDCAIRQTSWGAWKPFEDPEQWDIAPFLKSLGPTITTLDLRHVCQTMLLTLASHGDKFATCERLATLRMDITEGVWDWDGRGSPQRGATADYVFPPLGLPAVSRFELVVADRTVSKPRAGPLDLVNCSLLCELSLDIRRINSYDQVDTIDLFDGLSPAAFPALKHLEIKDYNDTANRRRLLWETNDATYEDSGRCFTGLILSFLPALPNLVSLWADETALFDRRYESVRSVWNLYEPIEENPNAEESDAEMKEFLAEYNRAAATRLVALCSVLSQLESLRVGFGRMDDAEVGAVLGACDPAKLHQFGFEWAWHRYGRDEPISPALLTHLARFPNLTDMHILFPRPTTQSSGTPDPTIDALTLADVSALFACNPRIARVGIGNSLVWERHLHSGVLLVSDGSAAPNAAVPPFFHAGYLAKYTPNGETSWVHSDNKTPLRPKRGEEIEQMRDLLERILR